jgi:transcriptional regulator with XRE-family HTH domain
VGEELAQAEEQYPLPGQVVARRTAQVLGFELRRLRKQRGWTRGELRARLLAATGHDLSRQTLATYELGTRAITMERLAALCYTYGVRPSTLLSIVDDHVLGAEATNEPQEDTISVDLRPLARSDRACTAPIRAWALTQLNQGRITVRLTASALTELATACGVEVEEISAALRGTATANPTDMRRSS